MQHTDYARIAARYDANTVRHAIAPEPLLAAAQGSHRRILDIACGTGLWLSAQIDAFPQAVFEWFGIDASNEMLEVARGKRMPADLQRGDAQQLPFPDSSFDFAACNFALHHFTDKIAAIREARRVLRDGGHYVMTNVCPEHMADSWIYRFFPESVAIDEARFIPNHEIIAIMTDAGFATDITTTVTTREFPMEPLIREAENRDTSQLTLISDAAYENGLERMRAHGDSFMGSFALVRAVGRAT